MQLQGSGVAPIWDDPRLPEKVRRACAIARKHGFQYIWIDSCCINTTSSSQLSEAINLMYVWYQDTVVCHAYIADVPRREGHYQSWSREAF